MSHAERLATAAASLIDLRVLPFTVPGSRLLIRSNLDGSLQVIRAAYEVSPDDGVVVTRLELLDAAGHLLEVSEILVDRIRFGPTAVLTFSGTDRLSIAGAAGVRVVADGVGTELRLGEGQAAELRVEPKVGVGQVPADVHGEALAQTARTWRRWFERCPVVAAEFHRIVAHSWWVLGVNTVELASAPGRRAVVPSKLGYLGLWQWDAYFIAIGLRHGDLRLAAEQLELAFAHAGADGQLPDVLHDGGVLASSADLPPADLKRLRELGSPAADPNAPISLTKPPLAALALARLAESGLAAGVLATMLPVVRRSQDWWLAQESTLDGLPVYAHPYSSGLDDSPVFDRDLPVATPDLAAYLVLQDRLLADLLEGIGRCHEAAEHRRRAVATRTQLLRLWDPDARRFRSHGQAGPLDAHPVIDLLPLLAGDLPAAIVDDLLAELADPTRFGTAYPVPTVALTDTSFAPERMWRGPSWVNTNWLLIEGLHRSGRREPALTLARSTLAMVAAGGGAYEYFHPSTAQPPASAVPMFSWTAALVIDLAVQLAVLDDRPWLAP